MNQIEFGLVMDFFYFHYLPAHFQTQQIVGGCYKGCSPTDFQHKLQQKSNTYQLIANTYWNQKQTCGLLYFDKNVWLCCGLYKLYCVHMAVNQYLVLAL